MKPITIHRGYGRNAAVHLAAEFETSVVETGRAACGSRRGFGHESDEVAVVGTLRAADVTCRACRRTLAYRKATGEPLTGPVLR